MFGDCLQVTRSVVHKRPSSDRVGAVHFEVSCEMVNIRDLVGVVSRCSPSTHNRLSSVAPTRRSGCSARGSSSPAGGWAGERRQRSADRQRAPAMGRSAINENAANSIKPRIRSYRSVARMGGAFIRVGRKDWPDWAEVNRTHECCGPTMTPRGGLAGSDPLNRMEKQQLAAVIANDSHVDWASRRRSIDHESPKAEPREGAARNLRCRPLASDARRSPISLPPTIPIGLATVWVDIPVPLGFCLK